MATQFGRYELLDRISIGGMAEVFRGRVSGAAGFEKVVAIKRILPQLSDDEEFIGMFVDEAKISAKLTHSNIGQVFEFGRIENSHFIAMEFISGKDLRTMQLYFKKTQTTMPIPMAIRIVLEVCNALEYAHTRMDQNGHPLGIVHRDVSPPNILVSYQGAVKLIDFGIAKALSRSTKTAAGHFKGKVDYMSPEQVRGQPVDHRSDIFGLGTVLWEMLVGERLFRMDSEMATMQRVSQAIVLPPSSKNAAVPARLDEIVLKALARDPEERYLRAQDLHQDLEHFAQSHRFMLSSKQLSRFMKATFVDGPGESVVADVGPGTGRVPGAIAPLPPSPPVATLPLGMQPDGPIDRQGRMTMPGFDSPVQPAPRRPPSLQPESASFSPPRPLAPLAGAPPGTAPLAMTGAGAAPPANAAAAGAGGGLSALRASLLKGAAAKSPPSPRLSTAPMPVAPARAFSVPAPEPATPIGDDALSELELDDQPATTIASQRGGAAADVRETVVFPDSEALAGSMSDVDLEESALHDTPAEGAPAAVLAADSRFAPEPRFGDMAPSELDDARDTMAQQVFEERTRAAITPDKAAALRERVASRPVPVTKPQPLARGSAIDSPRPVAGGAGGEAHRTAKQLPRVDVQAADDRAVVVMPRGHLAGAQDDAMPLDLAGPTLIPGQLTGPEVAGRAFADLQRAQAPVAAETGSDDGGEYEESAPTVSALDAESRLEPRALALAAGREDDAAAGRMTMAWPGMTAQGAGRSPVVLAQPAVAKGPVVASGSSPRSAFVASEKPSLSFDVADDGEDDPPGADEMQSADDCTADYGLDGAESEAVGSARGPGGIPPTRPLPRPPEVRAPGAGQVEDEASGSQSMQLPWDTSPGGRLPHGAVAGAPSPQAGGPGQWPPNLPPMGIPSQFPGAAGAVHPGPYGQMPMQRSATEAFFTHQVLDGGQPGARPAAGFLSKRWVVFAILALAVAMLALATILAVMLLSSDSSAGKSDATERGAGPAYAAQDRTKGRATTVRSASHPRCYGCQGARSRRSV